MHHPDICIAGAGIIGLSLALELHHRGHRVIVFDRQAPLAEASIAAAGMLAAADPDNPPQLRALANLSLSLYPDFLERLHTLSNLRVAFQTHTTLQSLHTHEGANDGELSSNDLTHLLPALSAGDRRFLLLDEHSLDPRQLASALLAAVQSTSIELRPHTPVLSTHSVPDGVEVRTATGRFTAAKFIDCTGAWAASTSLLPGLQVSPRKGQMLYVALPSSLPLHFAVRTPQVYIVPRTSGPNAGRAIIGATVEDVGFNKTVHSEDIANLRRMAEELLPPLAHALQFEAWSGLRPATPDSLPLLGSLPGHPNHLLATGHYRNGILLAPATALVMAQLICGETPSVALDSFSAGRILAEPA
jgi:glycine oxidase